MLRRTKVNFKTRILDLNPPANGVVWAYPIGDMLLHGNVL